MNTELRLTGVGLGMPVLFAALIGMGACGRDSGKGILGRLAEGLRKSGHASSALQPGQRSSALVSASAASPQIDRICGIPVSRRIDSVPGQVLSDMYCVDVNADGTFTIPVGKEDHDWVYALIDSSKAKKDQVVGFVGLQDIEATGAMMLSWPANAQDGDANVGTVSAGTGGDITASGTVKDNQQAFSLTLEQLEALAKNSQLMRAMRNDYVNFDPATNTYYSAGPTYQWNVDITESVDKWSPLPAAESYWGYGINVYHNDRAFNASTLCKGGSGAIAVVPPTSITVTGKDNSTVTFGPDNPLTNTSISAADTGQRCYDDSGSLGVSYSGDPPYIISFFSKLKQDISGDWIIKKDGTAIIWFDVAMTAPFFDGDATKAIRAPVPRGRITLDADRKLTKVEISWWVYDLASATYVEATDLVATQRLLGGIFHVGIHGQNGKKAEKLLFGKDPNVPMQTTFTSFENAWTVAVTPGNGELEIREITMMYSIARTGFSVNLAYQ